jgi:hypothetical protein
MEMHKTEIAANRGMYEALVEKFRVYRMKELYGYNFSEFLQLPNDTAQMLIRDAIRASAAENKQDAAAAQLAEELRKLEGQK